MERTTLEKMTDYNIDNGYECRMELLKIMNYAKSNYQNYQERKNYIEECLTETDLGNYIVDYFYNDGGYNYSPTNSLNGSKSKVAEDDLICQALEYIADILLYADDVKDNGNYIKTVNLNNKNNKELKFDDMKNLCLNNTDSDISSQDLIVDDDVKIDNNSNFYLDKSIRISVNEDVNNPKYIMTDEDGQEHNPIKDYWNYREELKRIISEGNADKSTLSLARKHSKLVSEDLSRTKAYCISPINLKISVPDTQVFDWDMIDWYDGEHILALLAMNPRNIMTDLGIVLQDLENLLKLIPLSYQDKLIISKYREGYKNVDIAEYIGKTPKYVARALQRIANKIIERHEDKIEDWYYLNIRPIRYKTCSKCKTEKYANVRHFSPDAKNSDGLRSNCRKCR